MRTFSENQDLIAQRREQIAVSSSHLLAKKGYDKTTVNEISEACNMPIGMLYHYIGSKEDILTLVFDQALITYENFFLHAKDHLESLQPTEGLTKSIDEFYRLVDKHDDYTVLFFQHAISLSGDNRKRVLDWDRMAVRTFEQFLIAGCKTGEFKKHNTALLAQNIVTGGELWAVKRWALNRLLTIDDYVKEQTDLLLSALSPIQR
jgi:TetR/AcrR family transcriptional regulator, cholesterol catabolism regulator